MRTRLIINSAAIALIAAVQLGCDNGAANAPTAERQGAWTVERRRDVAARLSADGLEEEALAIYEALLDEGTGLNEKGLVGLALTVADIHIKRARYERALGALYRAAALAPEGEAARKLDEKRILCFERLGKSAAADRLLDRATAADREGSANDAGGDEVLASAGSEQVTRKDLDAVMAAAPPEMRQRADTKEGRTEIVRSLLARRLLERKARKLALDEDAKVRLAVREAEREVLVRKLVADEVSREVEVAPDDVRLWFEANKERFREPFALSVSFIEVADAEQEARVRAALETETFEVVARRESRHAATAARGGEVDEPLIEGRSHPLFATPQGVFVAAADAEPGSVLPESIPVTGARRVVLLRKREGGRAFTFDEVKEEAERRLRAEREKAALDALLKRTLEEADVVLHEERL